MFMEYVQKSAYADIPLPSILRDVKNYKSSIHKCDPRIANCYNLNWRIVIHYKPEGITDCKYSSEGFLRIGRQGDLRYQPIIV